MRFTFTWREVGNLTVSTLVLGLIFSFNNINNLVPTTLIVGVAFIFHELAHKFVAEHFDCKAEYVLWPQGIVIAIVIAFLSRGNFIFAALGFVSINPYFSTRLGFHWTHLSLEELGKISASGPVVNIILGIIFALLTPFHPLMGYGATLNFVLALFNLLPIPPLDGSQVFVWSRMAWVSLVVTAGTVFALTFLINPLIAAIIGLVVMGAMLFYTFQSGF